jgi:hypothetical protein
MDRLEEYAALRGALDQETPERGTVASAQARARHTRRIRRRVFASLSGVTTLLLAFALLVNVSAPFAAAMGNIPLLRELAAAVAFSPSLSAAVENEYVQPMELTQTRNGVTMAIPHVIVDQKQLNVFYTLESPTVARMRAEPRVAQTLEGYSLHAGGLEDGGTLQTFVLDFHDNDVPDSVTLRCEVFAGGTGTDAPASAPPPGGERPLAEFTFTLRFDPYFTAQGEVLAVNQIFTLDGQKLTVASAEIYPTHLRVNVTQDAANTAWLKGLEFSFVNGRGERFEGLQSGVTASSAQDDPYATAYRLESAFFSDSERLTMEVTGADWLDKDRERVNIDLVNAAAEWLPEGVRLESAYRAETGWELVFSAPEVEERHAYQLFQSRFCGADGAEREISEWSTADGYTDPRTGAYAELPGRFCERFPLKEFTEDTVVLFPAYSRRYAAPEPVALPIK